MSVHCVNDCFRFFFSFFPGICNTSECLELLVKLLQAQNKTVDPCADFFSYACGKWEANHTQETQVPLGNVFDVLFEENQLIMKRLLGRQRR